MAATYRAKSIARLLAENLALRTGLTATEGVDSSQNPTIVLGTGAAGAQGAFIRVFQDYNPSLQENGIGQTQRVYTPHVIQVVVEAGINSIATTAKLLKELSIHGVKVEVYEVTAATAPAVGGILAANLEATIDDLWFPMTGTV